MSTDLVPSPARVPGPYRPSERVLRYARHAKAERTVKTYQSAFNDFIQYCLTHRCRPLPAAPETVIEYLTFLADGGQKVSTLSVKLAAISYNHRAAQRPDPTTDEQVKLVMAGIRRTLGTKAHGKAPLLREELFALVETCGMDLRGLRNKALLLLGYAGAFRRSELVALDVEDLGFTAKSLAVTLRRSKTDQTGEGATKTIPRLDAKDATICPVRAAQAYLRAARIASGPVFRKIDRWNHVLEHHLTPQVVALIVKQAAAAAGLDAKDLSGHSLRVGFVTQTAADGAPDRDIQAMTLHKSATMLARYNREPEHGQRRAALLALTGRDEH